MALQGYNVDTIVALQGCNVDTNVALQGCNVDTVVALPTRTNSFEQSNNRSDFLSALSSSGGVRGGETTQKQSLIKVRAKKKLKSSKEESNVAGNKNQKLSTSPKTFGQ